MYGNKSTMKLLRHQPLSVMSLADAKQREACQSKDRTQQVLLDLLQKIADCEAGFVFQYGAIPSRDLAGTNSW